MRVPPAAIGNSGAGAGSLGRAGGIVSTVRRNGFVFEAGPQCPRFPVSVWNLVRELNLESEFVAGDPKAKRYILRDGRLHLAPFSPGGALTTRLVGPQSKYRLLTEVLRTFAASRHGRVPGRIRRTKIRWRSVGLFG